LSTAVFFLLAPISGSMHVPVEGLSLLAAASTKSDAATYRVNEEAIDCRERSSPKITKQLAANSGKRL
jgi:hypothetical protein